MLSSQEKQVLKYRQDGVSCRKIADVLGIKLESVWSISHTIVQKCTGQYDFHQKYEYNKRSIEKRIASDESYSKYMREYRREYMREYRAKNRKKVRDWNREYQEKNAEKLREYRRDYYVANKEKIRDRNREYQREYQKKSSNKLIISKRNIDIYQRFINGESVASIAYDIGISRQRIYVIISKMKAADEKAQINRVCAICGKEFRGKAHSLYCSSSCKNIAADQNSKK